MKRVTLLTKHDCHLCDDAQTMLEALRDELDFDFDAADLASERGVRLAIEAGLLFPPVLLVDGKPVFHGRLFEAALRRELTT